ncbi:MAG: hypothetical protein O7F10_09405 [Deltaproteobacteria bacterium]|nr:hypothetical protein [Deltaproteobacteria bacterium]
MRHFEDAVRIQPDRTSAPHKLGTALARQGLGDEAQRHRALALWLISEAGEGGPALSTRRWTRAVGVAGTPLEPGASRRAEAHGCDRSGPALG